MAEPTIICPKCKNEIKLTESLAAPLIESTRRDFEQRLAQKDLDVAGREKSIQDREAALSKAKDSLETQVAERVQLERGKIAADEAKKARLALSNDLNQKTKEVADLQEILKQKDEKLTEAQKVQADLLKQKRELDDAKRELDLTVEKRVQENLTTTRQQARKEAEDEMRLKVSEKEQTISSMQKQIEDLKRRAEQGSQQLQGEVQELELETLLKAKFPHDTVAPVPKGEHGGDFHPMNQQIDIKIRAPTVTGKLPLGVVTKLRRLHSASTWPPFRWCARSVASKSTRPPRQTFGQRTETVSQKTGLPQTPSRPNSATAALRPVSTLTRRPAPGLLRLGFRAGRIACDKNGQRI